MVASHKLTQLTRKLQNITDLKFFFFVFFNFYPNLWRIFRIPISKKWIFCRNHRLILSPFSCAANFFCSDDPVYWPFTNKIYKWIVWILHTNDCLRCHRVLLPYPFYMILYLPAINVEKSSKANAKASLISQRNLHIPFIHYGDSHKW